MMKDNESALTCDRIGSKGNWPLQPSGGFHCEHVSAVSDSAPKIWLFNWIVKAVWISLLGLAMTTGAKFAHSQTGRHDDLVDHFLLTNGLERLLLVHRESVFQQFAAEQAADETAADETAEDNAAMFQPNAGVGRTAEALELFHQTLAQHLFQASIGADVGAERSNRLMSTARRALSQNSHRDNHWLRLAVLHHQNERLRSAYWRAEFSPEDKTLSDTIRLLIDDLSSLQRSVTTQIEHLETLKGLQQLDLGEEIRLNELRQQREHTNLLSGWSYYWKWATDRPLKKQTLRDAESYFRNYLGIERFLNLNKFAADRWMITNGHRRSALIGLAMTMQGVGAEDEASYCFSILSSNLPPDGATEAQLQEILRWKFLGHLSADNTPAAFALLKQRPQLGREVDLLKSVATRNDLPQAIKAAAIVGAALNFEIDYLGQWVQEAPDGKGLGLTTALTAWFEGYLLLDRYRTSGDDTDIDAALDRLKQAAAGFTPDDRRDVIGHCHFLLGKTYLLKDSPASAANHFLIAIQSSAGTDRLLAGESIYLAIQSLAATRGDHRKSIQRLTEVLRVGHAHRPFLELLEIQSMAGMTEPPLDPSIIGRLKEMRTADRDPAVASAATTEIARRLHASEPFPGDDFDVLIDDLDRRKGLNDRCRIQSRLYFLAALTKAFQRLPSLAKQEIEIVNKSAATMAWIDERIGDPDFLKTISVTERRVQIDRFVHHKIRWFKATRSLDAEKAMQLFSQLQPSPSPSQWGLASALEIAAAFDSPNNPESSDVPGDRQWLAPVYRTILNAPNGIATTTQEAIAAKLTILLVSAGRNEEAKSIADQHDETPLWVPVKTALAEAENDFETSERLWRRLEQRLKEGSDDWFQARVGRLKAMHWIDSGDAVILWKRTITLYPNRPPKANDLMQSVAQQWGIK